MTDGIPSLLFGAVEIADDPGTTYRFISLVEGTNFGNPEPVISVVSSLLQDGEIERVDSFGVRVFPVAIRVQGDTLREVAEGEAALMSEVGRPNLITWTPPDDFADPCVFEVTTSILRRSFVPDWDYDENHPTPARVLELEIHALPFARALTETVTEALGDDGGDPLDPTVVSLDDAAALTYWESSDASFMGGPSLANGGVKTWEKGQAGAILQFNHDFWLRWAPAAPVNLTATPIVRVEWSIFGSETVPTQPSRLRAILPDGTSFVGCDRIADQVSPDGKTYTYFRVPVAFIASPTKLTFHAPLRGMITATPVAAKAPGLIVHDLSAVDVVPVVGTKRQRFRSLNVGGSVRTQGSLEVAATASLGEMLIYSWAADGLGYSPALTQFRTGGDPSPDIVAGTVSGTTRSLFGVTETSQVPASSLMEGMHSVLALVKATAIGWVDFTWSARVVLGSHESAIVEGVTPVHFDAADTWQIVEIARELLPPTGLPSASDALVEFRLASSAAAEIDDWWAFNLDIGALTWVDCGAGTVEAGGDSSRLWIDSPTVTRPRWGYWVGTDVDRTDSRFADSVKCNMPHWFYPGQLNVYSVSTNADDVGITFRHFERSMHHVWRA